MIWVDFAILGLVAISLVIGLLRGFIKEAFALGIWIVAIWIGLTFSRNFSVFLEPFITLPSARIAAAFAVLFIMTLILGAIISFVLDELVRKTGLTGSDRFVGMIFGIARGMVVVAVLVMLAGLTPLPDDAWWQKSLLIPPFQSLALWLRDFIPASMVGYVHYS